MEDVDAETAREERIARQAENARRIEEVMPRVAAVALRLCGAEVHPDDAGDGRVRLREMEEGFHEIEEAAVERMDELVRLLGDEPVEVLDRLARMGREELLAAIQARREGQGPDWSLDALLGRLGHPEKRDVGSEFHRKVRAVVSLAWVLERRRACPDEGHAIALTRRLLALPAIERASVEEIRDLAGRDPDEVARTVETWEAESA